MPDLQESEGRMNTALPSRLAHPGTKKAFQDMLAGVALYNKESQRVANVCAYWRANVSKKPRRLRVVRKAAA